MNSSTLWPGSQEGARVLRRLSCFWDCREVGKWPNTTRAPYVGLTLLNINLRGLIPQGSHEGRHPSGHRSYGHIPPKAIKNSRRQAVLPRDRIAGELGGMSSLQNILTNRLQNKKPVERNITGTWVSLLHLTHLLLDQEAAHTNQEGPGGVRKGE